MSKNNYEEELMKRINKCNRYKNFIANYPDKVNLKGLTQKQWTKYYDEEIAHCINELDKSKQNLSPRILLLSIFAVLFLAALILTPKITTLAIYQPEETSFEINKLVSTGSYILITSGSSEHRLDLSGFNLPIENENYNVDSLKIPLASLNLSQGTHNVVISLIDNNTIKAVKNIIIDVSQPEQSIIPR